MMDKIVCMVAGVLLAFPLIGGLHVLLEAPIVGLLCIALSLCMLWNMGNDIAANRRYIAMVRHYLFVGCVLGAGIWTYAIYVLRSWIWS